MDDFANILHRDYGLKPQGKSAPMSAARPGPIPPSISKHSSSANAANVTRWSSTPPFADGDLFSDLNGIKPSSSSGRHNFGSVAGADLLAGNYEDVFGGPPKFAPSASSDFLDDAFKTSSSVPSKGATASSHDAPVYDDDIFSGMPGINGTSSARDGIYNAAGSSVSTAPEPSDYDNLLGDFGASSQKTNKVSSDVPSLAADFEELLPGFGKAEPVKPRSSGDAKPAQEKYGNSVNKSTTNLMEDSFPLFGQDSASSSGVTTPVSNLDPFIVPDVLSRETNRKDPVNGSGSNNIHIEGNMRTGNAHPEREQQMDTAKRYMTKGSKSSTPPSPGRISESTGSNDANYVQTISIDGNFTKDQNDTHQGSSTVYSGESRSGGSLHRSGNVRSVDADKAPKSRQSKESVPFSNNHRRAEFSKSYSSRVDEYWISVEDIKLVTKPSSVPPPSRSPPVPGSKQTIASEKSSSWRMGMKQHKLWENGNSSSDPSVKGNINSNTRFLDEFEEFASGGSKPPARDLRDDAISPHDVEEVEGSAAATASGAAMKEAIERAESKLRQAKEAKNKDKGVQSRDEKPSEELEREQREVKAVREREEKERREKEREARERHRRERAREKEKERERERERQKDRGSEISQQQKTAVEGGNVDVRGREPQKGVERSAAEAKVKAERQAVEKAMAEARERHDRAALERAKAAEKERAAATEHQRWAEDDIESFFMSGSRPNSEPKQRSHATDMFSQRQQTSEGQRSPNTGPNVKKVPSMPAMVDDLSSIFGGPLAPGEFQEIDGEPEDRRKARWERHQRTLERAAKALDEKRQRDLQSEREQAERHRAGELVDAEIKRWAAGKEGNLRALLSSLHYVLWPESGWQPVTLTELITAAAVKKVYKKATLCVHPDKVQQKGATIHQKYIAEKVFDLLKEAWNKFNSEELF